MDDDIKARSHAGEAMSTEELARQAGFLVCDAGIYRDRQEGPFTLKPELERFAALVRADERAQALSDVVRMLEAEHEARKGADNHALFYAHMVRGLK